MNGKKIIQLVLILGLSVGLSACIPTGDKAGSTTAQDGERDSSGSLSGASSGIVPMGLAAKDAFQQTLYPEVRSRSCATCHTQSGGFAPFFADGAIATAFSAAYDGGKINLTSPANSPIVLKVRTNHNCGQATDCSKIADVFTQAIANMNVLMQAPVANTNNTGGTAGGTTGGTTTNTNNNGGGTIIPGLSSLESFSRSLYPILRGANCTGCHGDNGPRAPYASSNITTAHDALVGGGLVNLTDPSKASSSVIVLKIRGGHEGNGAALADQMQSAIVTWGALMKPTMGSSTPPADNRIYTTQVTIPTVANATTKLKTLEWDLSAIVKVQGVKFRVDISDLDQFSYVFKNPRLVIATGSIIVKGVMIHVNNVYNPGDSTFTIINDELAAPGGNLTNQGTLKNLSLIVLKGTNPALDKVSVSFEILKSR